MGPPEHGNAPHPHFTPNKPDSHLVKGSKVEVTSKDEGFVGSWFLATVIKPPEIPNSRSHDKRMTLVEYDDLLNEDTSLLLREHVDVAMLRPVPPGTEENGGFEVGDIVDAFEKDGWWTGVVDRIVKGEGEEGRYVVSFAEPKHEIEFGKDSMRLHLDWINGKWFRFWNGKTQELLVNEDGRMTLSINGNCNYPKENFILNPTPMGCDPECCIGMTDSMNEQLTPLNGKPIHPLLSSCCQDIIDLEFPSSSFSHSRPAKKLKTCVEEPLAHAISKPAEFLRDCKNKDSNYHITSTSYVKHNTSVRAKRIKKRARRSKGIPNASVPGACELSRADDVQEDLFLGENLTEAVGTEFSLQKQLTEAVGTEVSLQEQLTEAVGTELDLSKQGEAPKADSADNNPHMRELTLVAVGTELNPKEQGRSDLVNGERTSPVTEGMVVLNEQQQSAPNDVSVIGPSLPFLITSPIWKTVESLEMFRKFPQQPHFLPLIDARERFREGLAIAKMVTFASTAANVINLSFDDNILSITECLETLQSLELHGFNAKTLQRRLVKLISLKEMQQKIEEEKHELEGQVSELKHEIVKGKEEISDAVSMIKFYQDKLESALLKEEETHLEILALETSMDVLDTVICSARIDFEDSKDTWLKFHSRAHLSSRGILASSILSCLRRWHYEYVSYLCLIVSRHC